MPKKRSKTKARVRRPKPARKPKKRVKKKVSGGRRPRAKVRKPRRAAKRARKSRRPARRLKPARGKAARKPKKVIDPRVAQATKTYAEGMKHFNKQSFRRAKALFEKVVGGYSRELAERARVHIAICEQRLQRPAPVRFRGAEDHYHYAVAKINAGDFAEARTHLQKALKRAPKADYVHYALATMAALSGEIEEALDRLEQAIKLRPENRYQARNDGDFKSLVDEPRFLELVHPDRALDSGFDALRL